MPDGECGCEDRFCDLVEDATTPESEELLARAEARVRADGLAAAPAEDLLDLIEQMSEQMRVAAENCI